MKQSKFHNSLIYNGESFKVGFLPQNIDKLRNSNKPVQLIGLHILLELYYQGPATLSHLVRLLGKTFTTVYHHLDNLHQFNMIVYESGTSTITDKGRQYVDYYRHLFNGYRPG